MTATIAEVIQELQKYPDDTPVVRRLWGPMGPFRSWRRTISNHDALHGRGPKADEGSQTGGTNDSVPMKRSSTTHVS